MPEASRPGTASAARRSRRRRPRRRQQRRQPLAPDAREHRRRDAEHRERRLPEDHHAQHVGAPRRVGRCRTRTTSIDAGIATTTPTSSPQKMAASRAPARHVLAHRGRVALGPRARHHGEQDERDAEEQLVRQEREGLALLVDGEPRLDRLALRVARQARGRGRVAEEAAEQRDVDLHQRVRARAVRPRWARAPDVRARRRHALRGRGPPAPGPCRSPSSAARAGTMSAAAPTQPSVVPSTPDRPWRDEAPTRSPTCRPCAAWRTSRRAAPAARRGCAR